jgi:tetratricopeptide (TPR) repeat protein
LPALLVIVFVLSYYPYNIYKAGHLGAQAARWMWQNNYAEAQKYYKQAVVLDKTDGSYWMDMAQTEVGTYLITRENRRLKLADEYMEKALALQPYAIPLRMKALDLQLLLERGAEGVAAAQELVRLLPLEPRSHEGLARAAMLAAVGALDAKDDKLAATYVGKLLTIEKQYDMLMSRIPLDRPVGHRQNLTVTTRLCIGEGYALDGQYAKAIQYLSDARKDQVTASEAAIWLGLVYVKTGRVQEGNQLLTQLVAAKADLGPIVNRVALLLRLQMSEVPR